MEFSDAPYRAAIRFAPSLPANSPSGNGFIIPFGRPVVPDEYNIDPPMLSSAILVVGISAIASSQFSNPAVVPSSI